VFYNLQDQSILIFILISKTISIFMFMLIYQIDIYVI